MRKILIFLFLLLIVTGCGKEMLSPKNEIQKLFSNYNSLSSDVLIQLDSVMESENLSDENKSKYKEVLKRQYEDLKYRINDEIISEERAIVSVEVEVYDLYTVLKNAEENKMDFFKDEEYNEEKFWEYKLDKMLKADERVKYNIDLSLTKVDDEWKLDNLLEIDRQKIHGLYK